MINDTNTAIHNNGIIIALFLILIFQTKRSVGKYPQQRIDVMDAYCEKALNVLQDGQQTYQAKWIANQILVNAGYSSKEIELLRNKEPWQSSCVTICA